MRNKSRGILKKQQSSLPKILGLRRKTMLIHKPKKTNRGRQKQGKSGRKNRPDKWGAKKRASLAAEALLKRKEKERRGARIAASARGGISRKSYARELFGKRMRANQGASKKS